jgi:sirohydrochlorin ferrochelatase
VSAPQRAVVLVDHGSRRPEANAQLEELAALLREREPSTRIATAHLEVLAPSIGDAIAECARAGAGEIVVLPWFLAPGRHTAEDIPRQVDAARAAHPGVEIRVGDALGLHAKLVEVALERIAETRRR